MFTTEVVMEDLAEVSEVQVMCASYYFFRYSGWEDLQRSAVVNGVRSLWKLMK